MEIETLVVGYLEENCYIITKNGKSLIIDPGAEADKILDAVSGKDVVGILLTHRHFDHIGAFEEVSQSLGIEILSSVEDFNCEIIKTPGHTEDSVTYYFPDEKLMFTGDFIFCGSIGRMDLPGGSVDDMTRSLEMISAYPDETTIYPGHGCSTTLKNEKTHFKNYF